jgi:NAD(P)-dependent dehydrogenase (short-subunit alcohol dehydrogenase family)
MSNILIVGATRGLGAALTTQYAANPANTVYATTRSSTGPALGAGVHWIPNIDLLSSGASALLASALPGPIDTLIITAGIFPHETLAAPDFDAEVRTYTTCAVAPVFVVHHLVANDLLRPGAKLVLVSSEAGSIALRHESEGGGNYAHHASKAAVNMLGKLLSLDLKDKAIAVAIVHVCVPLLLPPFCVVAKSPTQPGFMRTEMTKNVGYDQYWESGGGMSHPHPIPTVITA